MNNSTRNLKMKKLLISTTALVATAGMASADITITGHAAACIYSGLSKKDGTAKVEASASKAATGVTSTQVSDHETATVGSNDLDATASSGLIDTGYILVNIGCLLYTSPSPRD